MNKSSNVIDLKSRLKRSKKTSGDPGKFAKDISGGPSGVAQVLDMTERRQETIRSERRKVRRTILSEFVSAFTIVPQKGLQKVALYDISGEGLAFDLENDLGAFNVGDEIAMRVYLNQYTYFPFVVKVSNVRHIADEGLNRHGVNFVLGTVNDEALHHFIKFIETVSASLETDHGDVMVSNLRK